MVCLNAGDVRCGKPWAGCKGHGAEEGALGSQWGTRACTQCSGCAGEGTLSWQSMGPKEGMPGLSEDCARTSEQRYC